MNRLPSNPAAGIVRPRETAAAPTVPGTLKAGQWVLLKGHGLGQVLAAPGDPNGFLPAQLQGHVIALFRGVQVRRPIEELVLLRPAKELLAEVDPALHERLRTDPAYQPRVRKNALEGIDDDYFSAAQAEILRARYIQRLPPSQAVLAAEYGAYLGKDEGWVRERVRSGKLQPEQVIVTARGEDYVFKREPRGILPPPEAKALRDLLNTAGFGDEVVAPRVGLQGNRVRKIRHGGTTTRQRAARLRIAVEELSEAQERRTLPVSPERFAALRAKTRYMHDALGWSYGAIDAVAGAAGGSARAVATVQKGCSHHVHDLLDLGLARVERFSAPLGRSFTAEDVAALSSRLGQLPLAPTDWLPTPLMEGLTGIVADALALGHDPIGLSLAAGTWDSVFRIAPGEQRTLSLAKQMVAGLATLLGMTPQEVALAQGRRPTAVDDAVTEVVADPVPVRLPAPRAATEVLDALSASFDRLHDQHWSLHAMAEACHLKKHQVWAFSVERTCTPEIAVQLSAGFQRLEVLSQPPMGPLGFHRRDFRALLARLDALPLGRYDLFIEPLNQALETLIDAARSRGYRASLMGDLASVDRGHYPTGQGLNRRMDVARRMLLGLIRLLDRESAPSSIANGPGTHLSPLEETALRAEIDAAHFLDVTIARKAELSVGAITAFRRGGGIKRVNAVRVQQAIKRLIAAGARRDAEISPEVFRTFRQQVETARANGWSLELMHGLGSLTRTALIDLDDQSTCAYHVWEGGTAALDKLTPVGRPFEHTDFGLDEPSLSALQARLDAMKGWPDHSLIPLLSNALGRIVADAHRRGFTPTSLAALTDTRSLPFEAMEPGERRSLPMAGRMMRGLWAALDRANARAAS